MSRVPRSYRVLLGLCPARYRRQYGAQMEQTLVDMLADLPTPAERRHALVRAELELPGLILREQVLALSGFTHEVPPTIRRSTVLAGTLLLPFTAALVANGVVQEFWHHTLYKSWLWSSSVVTAWLLVLPLTAVLIAVAGYMRFTTALGRNAHTRALDFRKVWPLLVVALVGLSIVLLALFHDSAHCLLGNPIRTLHNPHDTLLCIQRGYLGGK